MFGILRKGLDKLVRNNFDHAYDLVNELSEPYKIIVAEILGGRYDETLSLMENNNSEEIRKHLFEEAIFAGKRIKFYESKLSIERKAFWECCLAEAKLAQSFYQCLQLESTPKNILHASNTINHFVTLNKALRDMYQNEIDAIEND